MAQLKIPRHLLWDPSIWDVSQFLTRLLKHSLSPASILFRICIPRERNQHHVLCNKCHNCGVHPPFSDPDIRFLGFSLLWAMCPHCNNWYIPVKWSDKSVIFTTVTHISPSLSHEIIPSTWIFPLSRNFHVLRNRNEIHDIPIHVPLESHIPTIFPLYLSVNCHLLLYFACIVHQ